MASLVPPIMPTITIFALSTNDNPHDDDDNDDLYIIGAVCMSVCHKSHYFCIQKILLFLLFIDTFRIQDIWSFLLFLDTFRIQDI